jgi:LysR family transcriptional activator of dmlA
VNLIHESTMQEREMVAGMAVFVAAVQGGSFSAAARATGLTPSAVSKAVARLEQGFGAPLLRRSTRRMQVTDAGQIFFERSRAVLEELRSVDAQMASNDSNPRGRLRITAPLVFGQTRVAPALLSFMKKAPAVSIDLDLTDRFVDLVEERIDVAVRVTAAPPPSFVARRVGSMRRVLCASPAYLRARSVPQEPADLSDHACLLFAGPQSSAVWDFPAQNGGPLATVRVDPRLRVSSMTALLEATKAGLGIADLPRYLVEEDLQARRLVAVLEPFETRANSVFVLYTAGAFLPTRTREAAKHLVKELTRALS